MAVSDVYRQLRTGSISPDRPTTGVTYNYGASLSPFDEFTACLDVGNLYPREDSFDGFAAIASDAQCVQRSSDVSLDQTTRPVIIYPWMKQRRPRHRNGKPQTLFISFRPILENNKTSGGIKIARISV